MSTDNNNTPKDNNNSLVIGRTLFFTSIKDNSFDYTLPIKASLNKFNNKERAEAPPSLFEYLCYKITQKKLLENKINKEVAIISEKFLSSKNCKINIMKTNSIKKKFILIPIRNNITRKWNAVIFVHLEKQIMQFMNQINDEPIIAKIISSNINSEEDDFILNTTMDRIETAFNFSSPEDIQFEVDSINISDQPNTSIFLLNFIEGLISQENNESIMNYIMKLYDESSNTNAIGSNNYFISFNKENPVFNDLTNIYENELKEFTKQKESNNSNGELKMLKLENIEDIDSEDEALKIIAKENEEVRRQMQEQELFFSLRMNDFNNNKNILGQIQEVEELDEESEMDNENKNSKNFNLNKSVKKSQNDLLKSNKSAKSNNNRKIDNEIIQKNLNDIIENLEEVKKEESVELKDNNIIDINDFKNNNNLNNEIKLEKKEIKENENISNNNKLENENKENSSIPNIDSNTNKKKYNLNINMDNITYNSGPSISSNQKDISLLNSNNNNNNSLNPIINNNINSNSENDDILFEKIKIPRSLSKTIEVTNSNNNSNICSNSNRQSINSNNAPNAPYERKKLSNSNISITKSSYNSNSRNNLEKNYDKSNNSQIYIPINISSKSTDSNNSKNKNENLNNSNNSNEEINSNNNLNLCINMNQNNCNYNISNKNHSLNLLETKETSNNIIYDSNNIKNENIVYTKKYQKPVFSNTNNNNNINTNDKKENKNKVNNNNIKGKNKNKINLPLVKKNIKNNSNSNDNNQYKNNTIIINGTTNNKTVFIEIKNGIQENNKNENKKVEDKISLNNNPNNQIWNINISNLNNINLINNKLDENEYITNIPVDGTVNRISTTLSPSKTITGINNQENFFKTVTNEEYLNTDSNKKNEKEDEDLNNNNLPNNSKLRTFSENNVKVNKLSLLDNYLYGKNKEKVDHNKNKLDLMKNEDNKIKIEDNKDTNNELKSNNEMLESKETKNENDEKEEHKDDNENKLDVNLMLNTNRHIIQRRTTRTKRLKGENRGKIGFIKDYEPNDCVLNLSKDLKCGCTGNVNPCSIF